MQTDPKYDLAIVGGGLAGLSLAIMQSKAGKKVILFEKNAYPSHKVCGEYVSLEAWDFLESLGLDLTCMDLPIISKLQVSSPKGTSVFSDLDLGGFGISRYTLDHLLFQLAITNGVEVKQKTKVLDIKYEKVTYEVITENAIYSSKMAVGSFGKRSNLDIEWKRPFVFKNRTSLNQYVGVKYHIQTDFPKDLIALHNFQDGYCGVSAIENNQYCLCYLTTKKNLQKSDNDIETMERKILSQNPFLAELFRNSDKIFTRPEVISQISFEKKGLFHNNVPMVGDAAGMIAPLSGNGMSMALKGAVLVHEFLQNGGKNINLYTQKWNQSFGRRLWVGRLIQSLFGDTITTDVLIRIVKLHPKLISIITKNTHGSKMEKFEI